MGRFLGRIVHEEACMTIVSLICFSLNFLVIISCFRRGADPLSPGRIFTFVWALSIGLADLKFSRFQHIWSLYSWIIFLIGIMAFLLGVFIMYCFNLDKPLLPLSEVRDRIQRQARDYIDPQRFFRVIVVLFVAYLTAYCVEVAIEGTVPLFSKNIEKLRIDFGTFGIHLITNTMVSVMFLVVEYFLIIQNYKRNKIWLGVIFLLTTFTFFLLLQRYNFFVWAVMALGLTYYTSRHIRFRNLFFAGGAFFGLLVLIRNLRITQYVQQYHYVISKMKYPPMFATFTEPYMYTVMNLENFARGVDKLDQFYYGYFTFDWVLALTGLKHWLEAYFRIERLPFLVSGYNTFTFHWWYYYDFGIIGVALIPFLSGFVIAQLYFRLRAKPTIITATLYSMALLLMIISFIMNPLNRLDFVSNVVLIWFVNIVVHQTNANKSLA
jgi:oligosaccharide repeat unit polymerase